MRSSYRGGNSIQFSMCLMASDFVRAGLGGGWTQLKEHALLLGLSPGHGSTGDWGMVEVSLDEPANFVGVIFIFDVIEV